MLLPLQANHLRILELRDRIRTAPAPFLYAQLGEEYRRARDLEGAVTCCRECLAKYPAYLSVRVILGRALAERGELDAAVTEFTHVLSAAPDNLTATRDLAEIELRLGHLAPALEHYRRALSLFQGDKELEERVETLTRLLASGAGEAGAQPPATPVGRSSNDRDTTIAPAGAPPPSVDFDAILTSLGATDQRLPPLMEMLLAPAPQAPPPVATTFTFEAPPASEAPPATAPNPALTRLEEWLAAIERRRTGSSAADRHAHRPV
jgi:tetratricopeptide (TPR) repeat protein